MELIHCGCLCALLCVFFLLNLHNNSSNGSSSSVLVKVVVVVEVVVVVVLLAVVVVFIDYITCAYFCIVYTATNTHINTDILHIHNNNDDEAAKQHAVFELYTGLLFDSVYVCLCIYFKLHWVFFFLL